MSQPEDLIAKVAVYVESYMNNFDGSHDFNHIKRVLGLSHRLYNTLSEAPSHPKLDLTIITLSALLHDVGDRKYLKPGEDPNTLVQNLLLSLGASAVLAQTVQTICSGVSYSSEIQDRQKVLDVIKEHPELAVVQDADRLDAIGAVGVGRVFTYGSARTSRSMQESMGMYEKKLFDREASMKTEPGREMARERTERLRVFKGWWDEEIQVGMMGEEVLAKMGKENEKTEGLSAELEELQK